MQRKENKEDGEVVVPLMQEGDTDQSWAQRDPRAISKRRSVWMAILITLLRSSKKLLMILLIMSCGLFTGAILLSIFQDPAPAASPTFTKPQPWVQKMAGTKLVGGIKALLPQRFEDRVVLAIKSGSSVIMERLPVHLLNYEKGKDVIPNMLLYSDAEMQLGGYKVLDALSNVSEAIKEHEDFKPYAQLHKIIDSGGDIKDFHDGWKLDKYKFFPLWGDAYRRFPDADWYIGMEADVFFIWSEMIKFLKTQDPSKQALYGCPNILLRKNTLFANGGCGYIMSSALMKATYGTDLWGFENKYADEVKVSCCGDAELTDGLLKTPGVTIKELDKASGMRFQNMAPWNFVFQDNNWCEPVLTFHHVDGFMMQHAYDFKDWIEQRISDHDSVRYSDIFDFFSPKFLKDVVRTGWAGDQSPAITGPPSNVFQMGWQSIEPSDGPRHKAATPTWQGCEKLCRDKNECMTWYWEKNGGGKPDGTCTVMEQAFKIGKRSLEEGDKRVSGWIGERIDKFRAKKDCSGRLAKVTVPITEKTWKNWRW